MATTRKFVDYKNTKYDGSSKNHQEFINQEIADFYVPSGELNSYDHRTELFVVLMGCAWLFGYIDTGPALLLCIVYAKLSHEFFGRPGYASEYQGQLNKLYELYTWCIESDNSWSITSSPKKITSDETFLKLTTTILPYVSTNDLKKPLKDWNRISVQFKQLLLQHPKHRNEVLKDIQSTGGIWHLFKSSNENDEVVQTAIKDEEKSKSISGRVKQSIAEAKFTMYGRATENQQSLTERAQQFLTPAKILFNLKS